MGGAQFVRGSVSGLMRSMVVPRDVPIARGEGWVGGRGTGRTLCVMRRPIRAEQIEVVDERMAAIYRAMTPGQRLAVAFEAHEFAWKMCLKRERDRRPGAGEAEVIRGAWERMGLDERR